jgi:hypothetical protein
MAALAGHLLGVEAEFWAVSGFGGHGLADRDAERHLIASAFADGDDRCRYVPPYDVPFVGGFVLGRTLFELVSLRNRPSSTRKVGAGSRANASRADSIEGSRVACGGDLGSSVILALAGLPNLDKPVKHH